MDRWMTLIDVGQIKDGIPFVWIGSPNKERLPQEALSLLHRI